MYDNGLFLRTSGAGSLTQTETATGVAINRTPKGGLACVINVPKQSVGDTITAKLQHSTDDSTYTDLVNFEVVASTTAAITDSSKYVRRFATELKYVRSVLTVAGTSPDFGAVTVVIGDADQWNNVKVGAASGPGNTIRIGIQGGAWARSRCVWESPMWGISQATSLIPSSRSPALPVPS